MPAGNKKSYKLLWLQVCLPPGIKELKVQLCSLKHYCDTIASIWKQNSKILQLYLWKNLLQFPRRGIYDFCL